MNINLNEIREEHLLGEWIVENRYVNRVLANPFEETKRFEFKKNLYRSANGKIIKGKWVMAREKELIHNPQVKFYIGESKISEAIITRLYLAETSEQKVYKLILYFSNGLELILRKLVG